MSLPNDFARQLVENLHESVVVTEADLEAPGPRIVYVNRGFEKMTGYRAADVIGRSPRMLQGPATDRRMMSRLVRQLEEGEAFEDETINYRRDGREYLVRWYIEPLRDAEGETTHFLAVQRDVTEERRTQRDARRLATALSQLSDGALVLDAGGHIRHANRALCEMLDLAPEDLLGRQLVGNRFVDARVVARGRRALLAGGAFREELSLDVGTGPRFVEVAASPLRDSHDDLTGFVLGIRDLTEHRRLESVASALNATENAGFIVAGIRHELGNPINSIKAALSVVRANVDTFERDKVLRYLDGVLEEVGRVEYLLQSLRSFGMLERPEVDRLTIAPFLARFEGLVRRDFEQRAIGLQIEADDCAARADGRALHHVLLNLLTNAAEALPDEGERLVRVRASRSRSSTDLVVEDSGPGVPDAFRSRLFQPFQTTKSRGSGMGLAITQRLVAQMGGTIEVGRSELGGARFRVSLEAA